MAGISRFELRNNLLVDLEGAVERELLYHLETPEGH